MILACVIDWSHVWAALSALGSILTLTVAVKALNTWHREKQYDLTIENLALCNSVIQYIQYLRYPIAFDDEIINHEYKKKLSELSTDDEDRIVKHAVIKT
jgi:hypothetical protein